MVRRWINDLDPRRTFADDPIKTRFQYLEYFSPAERRQWIDAAISALDAQDEVINQEYVLTEALTEFDLHVLKGVLDANKVRRKWLEAAKKKI